MQKRQSPTSCEYKKKNKIYILTHIHTHIHTRTHTYVSISKLLYMQPMNGGSFSSLVLPLFLSLAHSLSLSSCTHLFQETIFFPPLLLLFQFKTGSFTNLFCAAASRSCAKRRCTRDLIRTSGTATGIILTCTTIYITSPYTRIVVLIQKNARDVVSVLKKINK